MKQLLIASVFAFALCIGGAASADPKAQRVNGDYQKSPSQLQAQGQAQLQGQLQGQQQGNLGVNAQQQHSVGTVAVSQDFPDIPVAGAYAPPAVCGPSAGVQFKDWGASAGMGMSTLCALVELHRVATISGNEEVAARALARMDTMVMTQAGQGTKYWERVPILRTVLKIIW